MRSPALEKSKPGRTLLVVDEDSGHREALDQLLSHEGDRFDRELGGHGWWIREARSPRFPPGFGVDL